MQLGCYWIFILRQHQEQRSCIIVGRAPGLTAGSKYTISVGYKDSKNTNNFFRFIITATLE
jgi:hypothetical protein